MIVVADSSPLVYLSRAGVLDILGALYGEVVAEVNAGVKRYDIVVREDPESRRDVQDVRDLVLRGTGGAAVRLREVADIGPEDAAMAIQRENARRKAVISTNVAEGYNLGHLVKEVKRVVDPIVKRSGYEVHYGGQFEAQQSASRTIIVMGLGVILVILLLLYMAFDSFRVNMPAKAMQMAVQDYLESKGHKTSRSHPGTNEGYVHGLGHGVGLKIHERPSISHLSEDKLVAGNVITIEPGVYYPDRGFGVRIEDMVYIADDGQLVTLTDFHKELVLPLKG